MITRLSRGGCSLYCTVTICRCGRGASSRSSGQTVVSGLPIDEVICSGRPTGNRSQLGEVANQSNWFKKGSLAIGYEEATHFMTHHNLSMTVLPHYTWALSLLIDARINSSYSIWMYFTRTKCASYKRIKLLYCFCRRVWLNWQGLCSLPLLYILHSPRIV